MENTSGSEQRLSVNVTLHEGQSGQTPPPARVYLFDRMGTLHDSAPLGKETVTFPVAAGRSYRVTVGPDLATDGMVPANAAEQLARTRAVSRDYVPRLGQHSIDIAIYPNIWFCWWQTCILVHGRVQKLLDPGSPTPHYATICNGTVQIFQVDLGCTLDRLASFNVITLRDTLVARLNGRLAEVERAVIPHGPINPDPPITASAASSMRRGMMAATSADGGAMRAASNTAMAATGRAALSLNEAAVTLAALDGAALKRFIVDQKVILWPFLCELIPDEWFCWQELGEAPIQSDGTFSAEICFWCPADFPDLYFEVVQNVNGIEREISDPPIACSTYYDYDGSQEVVITVDDPTAVACIPDPGRPIPGDELYVWPLSIGNVDLAGITDLENNPLISGATTGLLNGTTPWGGTLALKMAFDPRIKALSNLRYYRWSYKFDGDADFTPITETVTHRYATITYSPLVIHSNPVTLGPQPVVGTEHNLFQIPDLDPPPGDGWITIDDPYDVPFAYFDSTGNQYAPFNYTDAPVPPAPARRSGLCTLMLEMFDAAGNLAPCSNLGGAGSFVFVLPDLTTPGQYTSVLTSNNITPQGQLIFRVRIDNNDTVAQLSGVSTPSGSADLCGMLHYSSTAALVDIHYAATHPNDYLTWGLSVTRGLSGTVASASGATSSPPMSLPAPSTPGSFNNAASTLLGSCPNAAFAVNLDCYATATDGYGRQSQYDRSATIAFALINP